MQHVAYERMFRIEQDMWWYRGRRRVCEALLQRHFGRSACLDILDVGCGTGYNMGRLARWGTVSGIDMADEALAYCRQRGQTRVVQGDATRLPFADAAFDLVTAFDIIEHLDDDVAALREFRRVLRPGGHLLVYTPGLPFMYSEHDAIVHHKRRYWRGELLHRLSVSGFEPLHSSYVNMAVLPLVMAAQLVLRMVPQRPHVEMSIPAAPINAVLTAVSAAEVPLVVGCGLPLGLSLVALSKIHYG